MYTMYRSLFEADNIPSRPDSFTAYEYTKSLFKNITFEKPDAISDARWSGMEKWLNSRYKEGFSLVEMYEEAYKDHYAIDDDSL